MSGYYPPHQQVPSQYYNVDNDAAQHPQYTNAIPMSGPEGTFSHVVPDTQVYHGVPSSYGPYTDAPGQQAYVEQFDDGSAQAGNRPRRRSGPGDVKHRRTRSGCYTCRQRRVKCDETHPVCERCRKGNRECVYPEPQAKSKPGRTGSKSNPGAPGELSSPEDPGEEGSLDRLPPIADELEPEEDIETELVAVMSEGSRDPSGTPALTVDRSPSPASSVLPQAITRPTISRKPSHQAMKMAVPQDVRFYLDYFKNNITIHHYHLKGDSGDFFKNEFFDMALKYEPLRYAVVGYAAYFHTLSQPNGREQTFLQYYNKSINRLRTALERSKKHSLSIVLTILQLAAFEEMLGDWVNVTGHQKAAHDILSRLYTPETIAQSELLKKVLWWYTRFDLYVGIQAGGEGVLQRDWYVAAHEYARKQAREAPDNMSLKYDERFAYSRLIAKDANDFFTKKARGLLTDAEFIEQLPMVVDRMHKFETEIDPALLDPNYYVKDLIGTPDPEDIVNPYQPKVIWGGSRWTTNYVLLDMYGIIFMFQIQLAQALRKPFDSDIHEKALRVCRMWEAMSIYPLSPPGAIVEAQSALSIAALFLPANQNTVRWFRKRMAKIEAAGYIYSNTLRSRMLEHWGLEHSDWWLPNPQETMPPVIRSVKDWISERDSAPKDQTAEDLKEMRGVFATLTISDSPSESTPPSASLDQTLKYASASPDNEWRS